MYQPVWQPIVDPQMVQWQQAMGQTRQKVAEEAQNLSWANKDVCEQCEGDVSAGRFGWKLVVNNRAVTLERLQTLSAYEMVLPKRC